MIEKKFIISIKNKMEGNRYYSTTLQARPAEIDILVELVTLISSIDPRDLEKTSMPKIAYLAPEPLFPERRSLFTFIDPVHVDEELIREEIRKGKIIPHLAFESWIAFHNHPYKSETGKKHMLNSLHLFKMFENKQNTREYEYESFKIAVNLLIMYEKSFLKKWIKKQKEDTEKRDIWIELIKLGHIMPECEPHLQMSESQYLGLFNNLFPPSGKTS